MSHVPLISVVLPFHNNAGTVVAALKSILRQTLRDLEVIAIDDGSSDDGYARVQSVEDARIRLYRNERNRGVSATRNRGLDLARGAFTAQMDADDQCQPRRFELTLGRLQEDPRLGVCGGSARLVNWGPRRILLRQPCGPEAVRAFFLYGTPFVHDALLFRREVHEGHGIRYPEHLRAGEDYDFYYRCACVAGVDNVPDVLVDCHYNAEGLTATVGDTGTNRRLELLREELRRLLPEDIDDRMLRFHADVGNGAGAETGDDLHQRLQWLNRLVEANRVRNVYDPRGLAEATALVGFRVCRNSAHLGRRAWRAWRGAPWRASYRPRGEEYVAFLGSWVLSRCFPARRHPQGRLKGL